MNRSGAVSSAASTEGRGHPLGCASLEAAWESGDQVETCYELQGMAMAAAAGGNPAHALRLASAAGTNVRALGVEMFPTFWSAMIERHVAMARDDLGDAASDAAWRAGSLLSLATAVEEALATDETP